MQLLGSKPTKPGRDTRLLGYKEMINLLLKHICSDKKSFITCRLFLSIVLFIYFSLYLSLLWKNCRNRQKG